ncbi:OmpA family protein [Allosphingosinicella sp.]|uniref:OmpA family protein n=1 Tax=Allosphingosinicella sp. TaxID=2823234 RepID=UPI002FC0E22F
MKTLIKLTAAGLLATSMATPAFADESDRLIVNQLREKIGAVRAEPGVSEYGGAALDAAEASLDPLLRNLDADDEVQAAALTNRINALIETARVRAKIAQVKAEIERVETASAGQDEARIADAEAEAADARATAEAARAETERLRDQMKQTQLGATLVLQDVVFETARAELKPGAEQRLAPLVSYLQANPEVRVRIDGHTDSRGSTAYNQRLSEARAASVRARLASLGVDPSRIQAIGHGEATPVASNSTTAGRQQNRRVEVTLVGQQATNLAISE